MEKNLKSKFWENHQGVVDWNKLQLTLFMHGEMKRWVKMWIKKRSGTEKFWKLATFSWLEPMAKAMCQCGGTKVAAPMK